MRAARAEAHLLQHLHEHIKIEASHGPVEARRTAKQRIAMLVDAGALRLPLLLDDPVLGADQVCQQILRGDTKALNALPARGVRRGRPPTPPPLPDSTAMKVASQSSHIIMLTSKRRMAASSTKFMRKLFT